MSGDVDPGAAGRWRADLRDAGVLVRTELRVRIRHLLGNGRQLLAVLALVATFGVVFPLMFTPQATSFGAAIADGPVPAGRAGAVFLGVAALGLYLGGASGFGQGRVGSVGPLVRSSVPPSAVSLGRLVSELLQGVAMTVPTAVALLVLVGIGAGTPVAPLALAAAALPPFLAGVAAGRLVGDGLRVANRRLGVSLWAKALLLVVGSALAFVGTQVFMRSTFDDEGSMADFSVPAFLPGEPFQAYARAALDPVAAASQPLGVAVGLGLLASIPVLFAVALRTETGLLLTEDDTGSRDAVTGTRGVPRPFAATAATRTAWRYLLRARRDPRTLSHLMPLFFGAMGMTASVFTDPDSLKLLGPPAAVIGGACIAGAAFCLNPMGDDVDQLPLLLTSCRSTDVLLRGRALAGAIPGLVVAVGIGTPLAALTASVPYVVGQTLMAVALTAAGVGTALGAGALIPKFERREYVNVERAHPSMIALLGFFFGGMIVGAPGFLLLGSTVDGPSPLLLAGWAVYLTVLAVSGGGGYRYAVRRFDALTLDDV